MSGYSEDLRRRDSLVAGVQGFFEHAGLPSYGSSTVKRAVRALEALRGVLGETDQTDLFFTMGLDTSGATASAPAMPDTGGRGIEGFSAGTVLLGLSGALLLSGVLLLTWMARRGT